MDKGIHQMMQKLFSKYGVHSKKAYGDLLVIKLFTTNYARDLVKCMISDPIILISEISKILSFSTKTVNKRIANMKDNCILTFIVATDPLKMKGYIRFGNFYPIKCKF